MNNKCQSCGMIMEENEYGNNNDGSKSEKYCKYCCPDGEDFLKDETLEEMVETCMPFCVNDYPNVETARKSLLEDLSKLDRWKK